MGNTEPPLLAELYPALVSYLETALRAEGEQALAEIVRQLQFHGWCECKPSCNYLQTAPTGSASSMWIHLDDGDTPLVRLQFDSNHESFVGMEICEFALGPPPALDPLRPTNVL